MVAAPGSCWHGVERGALLQAAAPGVLPKIQGLLAFIHECHRAVGRRNVRGTRTVRRSQGRGHCRPRGGSTPVRGSAFERARRRPADGAGRGGVSPCRISVSRCGDVIVSGREPSIILRRHSAGSSCRATSGATRLEPQRRGQPTAATRPSTSTTTVHGVERGLNLTRGRAGAMDRQGGHVRPPWEGVPIPFQGRSVLLRQVSARPGQQMPYPGASRTTRPFLNPPAMLEVPRDRRG